MLWPKANKWYKEVDKGGLWDLLVKKSKLVQGLEIGMEVSQNTESNSIIWSSNLMPKGM